MSIPHFSFPFSVGEGGSAATVEQDTIDEIEQNVLVLVQTELGERLEVPDFGIVDPTFQTDYDPGEIAAAAVVWDERVQVLSDSEMSGMIETIRLQVEERNDD